MKVRGGGTVGSVIMENGKRNLMAIPSKKNPAIEQMLEQTFGRTTAIKYHKCVIC
ncbi:hypothetical protein LCGC14_0740370, partial [marine sediment metagenome]